MNQSVISSPIVRRRRSSAEVAALLAGGDDDPPFGENVFAKLAVKDELVATSLRHLRRRGQLVQKQNAFAISGQELGRNPLGLVRGDAWQPPQINGIELYGANVKEKDVEIARHLSDDLRFADAARAPDVQRHAFTYERMERFVELGWFHLDLPQSEYWFGCEERLVSRLFGNALDSGAGHFGAEQLRRYKLIPE